MLTSIDVKFILDSARLGLFSTANILQIAEVVLRIVSLLFLSCFYLLFRLVLTLEWVKCPPFLFSQPKQFNLVPRSSWLTVH